MAYMGEITGGKNVLVELLLDNSASGPALVFAAWATDSGASGSGRALVDPGDNGTIKLKVGKSGRLEIDVDLTDDDDTARLRVTVGGKERDSEKIVGDTTWSYAIT